MKTFSLMAPAFAGAFLLLYFVPLAFSVPMAVLVVGRAAIWAY